MTSDNRPPDDLTSEGVNGVDDFLRLLPGLFGAGNAIAAAQIEFLRQRAMAADTPTLLTPEELQEARRRGLIHDGQYDESLARHGFSEGARAVWRGLSRQLTDAASLAVHRRRETIGHEEYVSSMAALGFDEAQAHLVYLLTEYVPPAQDVVRFAVREVYTPEIAQRYGAFDDFPEDAMSDFERAGVTRDQALKYWGAHWELPSPQQAYEMLHRDAETGVTEDDVRTLLRAHDVQPFWRERMIAMATAPYTRVDVRRMHKLGILNREQMVRAYRDIGYNAERAEGLARFTEEINNAEDNEAAAPWRASLRSRAQSLYIDGVLSDDELAQTLRATGHSDEEIEFYLAESAFIVEGEAARDLRSGLKALYVGGTWTAGKVVTRLIEAGYEQRAIDNLIAQWDLAKEVREETAREREQRDLTRADILGGLADELLSEAEARQALQDLGYDDSEADLLVRRELLKAVQAERKRLEATTRGGVLSGRIGLGDARSILGTGGVPAARVESLLLAWTTETQASAPTLTVAQVGAALKRKLLTRVDAAERLDRLGYSTVDREVLLDLAEGTTEE